MKNLAQRLQFILIVGCGLLSMLVWVFHEPLYSGYLLKSLPWEEDGFKGKAFSELESALAKQGVFLRESDPIILYAFGRGKLKQNQRVMDFDKGKRFRWFYVGSAVKVGYVLVESEPGGERIVEIFHSLSVDSF